MHKNELYKMEDHYKKLGSQNERSSIGLHEVQQFVHMFNLHASTLIYHSILLTFFRLYLCIKPRITNENNK